MVGIAQQCVTSVYGYYPNGNPTGVATYGYSVVNAAASPMMLAILPLNFFGIQNVSIGN